MSITVQKIKDIEDAVRQCLQQIPEVRDNDKLLILKIWAYQNPGLRASSFAFVSFAEGFLKGEYAEASTITRCRRKLQEQHPELRGELWQKRHKEADDTAKEINQ